jgi:hypothetical protein
MRYDDRDISGVLCLIKFPLLCLAYALCTLETLLNVNVKKPFTPTTTECTTKLAQWQRRRSRLLRHQMPHYEPRAQ